MQMHHIAPIKVQSVIEEASFDDPVIDVIQSLIPVFSQPAYHTVDLGEILQDVIVDLDRRDAVVRIQGSRDDELDLQ